MAELRDESPQRWREAADMYRDWPFFRATVDNATLALAKTNLNIAADYFRLAGEPVEEQPFAALIIREYQRCCSAVAR